MVIEPRRSPICMVYQRYIVVVVVVLAALISNVDVVVVIFIRSCIHWFCRTIIACSLLCSAFAYVIMYTALKMVYTCDQVTESRRCVWNTYTWRLLFTVVQTSVASKLFIQFILSPSFLLLYTLKKRKFSNWNSSSSATFTVVTSRLVGLFYSTYLMSTTAVVTVILSQYKAVYYLHQLLMLHPVFE